VTRPVRVRLLGPIEVRVRGTLVPLSAQQRLVVSLLACRLGRVVPVAALMEAVWGDDPPASAVTRVHGLISTVRKRLSTAGAEGVVETRGEGYLACPDAVEVDLVEFEDAVREGHRLVEEARYEDALTVYGSALAGWQGPALAGLSTRALDAEAARLADLHALAVEDFAAARLALGQFDLVVPELRAAVPVEPFRERRRAQLMTALYLTGRRAEALQAYLDFRSLIVRELGVEPGAELRGVQAAVLAGARPGEVLAAVGIKTAAARTVPAPAGAAGVAPVRQLPPDVRGFVGRLGALRQLSLLLDDNSSQGRAGPAVVAISAISGMAGVGKTALAVHWAHQVTDRYPDGQLYADLQGYAPGPPVPAVRVLAGFLRALGVPAARVPVEEQEAAALYRSLLTGRRALVLLDNAADADQVRPLLPADRACLVVVTSRSRLAGLIAGDGARPLLLDVLDPDEALALVTAMIGPDRIAAEPAAARDLVALCGRLPLALRIAAAQVLDDPAVTIADYVARLREGPRLTALSIDDDARHNVRAAFALSYRRLSEPARRSFRLLGAAPVVDATVEAVAALTGLDTIPARAALAELVRAHLVERRPPDRYALHDLLRLYASELAAAHDPDRDEAVQRLLRWYLAGVDAAARRLYPTVFRLPVPATALGTPPAGVDSESTALAWLEAERPNLVAGVEHAARSGPRSMAWLLADTLRGYFFSRRHMVDWLVTARAGLAAARHDRDLRAQAILQLSLTIAHYALGDYQRSGRYAQKARALATQAEWPSAEAACLRMLGNIADETGRSDEASDYYRRSLAIYQRTGEREEQAMCLHNLGILHREQGNLEEAARCYSQSLRLRSDKGSTMSALGNTYRELGRLSEAADLLERALAQHRANGARSSEASVLDSLAAVHRDAGRYDQAHQHAAEALDLARQVQDRRVEAFALTTLGSIALASSNFEQAHSDYTTALSTAQAIDSRYIQAEALCGLAATALNESEPSLAASHARQALDLAIRGRYHPLERRAQRLLDQARPRDTEPHNRR
jgi:DNA-binding SARP family transcriptional activator/tetratricopeptide (TPR) repeat protein